MMLRGAGRRGAASEGFGLGKAGLPQDVADDRGRQQHQQDDPCHQGDQLPAAAFGRALSPSCSGEDHRSAQQKSLSTELLQVDERLFEHDGAMGLAERLLELESRTPWHREDFRAGLAALTSSAAAEARQFAADCAQIAALAAMVPRCVGDEVGGTPWTSFRREIAVARSISDPAALALIRHALRLEQLLPHTRHLLQAGTITVARARTLLYELDRLDDELRRVCAQTSTGQLVDLADHDVRPPPTPTGVRQAVLDMINGDTATGQIVPCDIASRTEPQHDPSPALRQFGELRDRTCDGPTGSTSPARTAQLDHDKPHPHGPTAAWNLAARATRTHGLKHYGWTPIRTATGTIWTSPPARPCSPPPA
jgi:hypothetical protein